MGVLEPTKQYRMAVLFAAVSSLIPASAALANQQNENFDAVLKSLGVSSGFAKADAAAELTSLYEKAQKALFHTAEFEDLAANDSVELKLDQVVGKELKTLKFNQLYKGLEVVGGRAMVHFDDDGEVADVTGNTMQAFLDETPEVSEAQALQILNDRYQQPIRLSEAPKLKVLKQPDGSARLVYHMLTSTTPTHDGLEVYLDAHTGNVALEFERAHDATSKGNRTVYGANTAEAGKHIDERGYPTTINFSWYDKVAEDGERDNDKIDRSGTNAYRWAGMVYDYYNSVHGRKSFDDKDSRIVSIVHIGQKMNNAFWTNEFKVMAYGDGDGEHLIDLTNGLDVAAHEMTHGVTASTSQLVYAAESGALNESFSDFFAKMVDYDQDNWDIGRKIMSPKWDRRALRNMKNPEEFKQPGSNDSALRKPTDVPCTRANDRCGVHTNSGIPNRATYLIARALGKEKAERLLYIVLTSRLDSTDGFKEMRAKTEKECSRLMGANHLSATDCEYVTKAFDTVKM